MKQTFDVKELLSNKLAAKLAAVYKKNQIDFRFMMEYFLARGLTKPEVLPDNLLLRIRTHFDVNNLEDLAALLKKLSSLIAVDDLKRIVGEIFLKLFRDKTESIFYLNMLLDVQHELTHHEYINSPLKTIIDFILIGIYFDQDCKTIFSGDFKTLLTAPKHQSKNKIMRICDALPNVDLIASLSIAEIEYLMQIHLQMEKEETYLRGQNFPVKVIAHFAALDATRFNTPELQQRIQRLLDVITHTDDVFTVEDARKSERYRQQIVAHNQELINWVLAKKVQAIMSPQFLAVYHCVHKDMLLTRGKSLDKVYAYLGGVVFLRLICPAILKYQPVNSNLAKAQVYKAEFINMSKMFQILANQQEDKEQSQLSPEQIALLRDNSNQSSDSNKIKMQKFLEQFMPTVSSVVDQTIDIVVNNGVSSSELPPKLTHKSQVFEHMNGIAVVIDLILNEWYEVCIARYKELKHDGQDARDYSIVNVSVVMSALRPKLSTAVNNIRSSLNLQSDVLQLLNKIDILVSACEDQMHQLSDVITAKSKKFIAKQYKNWQELLADVKNAQSLNNALNVDVSDKKIEELKKNIEDLERGVVDVKEKFAKQTADVKRICIEREQIVARINQLQILLKTGNMNEAQREAIVNELQARRTALENMTPSLQQAEDLKKTLVHQPTAINHIQKLLDSRKIELKILLLIRLRVEVCNLVRECNMRKSYDDDLRKRSVHAVRALN